MSSPKKKKPSPKAKYEPAPDFVQIAVAGGSVDSVYALDREGRVWLHVVTFNTERNDEGKFELAPSFSDRWVPLPENQAFVRS